MLDCWKRTKRELMARGKPYSRIIQAARLYPAVDNWVKYMTDATRRGSRVGQGKPRPPSKILYIKPFGLSMPTTQFARVSASETAWNGYKGSFTGYTSDGPLGANDTEIKPANFYPARIVVVEGRSNTGVADTSKKTGMKYLKYGGKSTSIPFGLQAAADKQETVFADIRGKISAANSSKSLRISHSKERLS